MALGYLYYAFITMSLIAIIGIALLFLLKNQKAVDAIMALLTIFSLAIAYLSASAQPTNFVAAQALSWIVGLVAVISSAIWFFGKHQPLLCRILVAISVAVGIYLLYFG